MLGAVVILLLLGVADALGPLGARGGDLLPGDAARVGPQGTEGGNKNPARAATVDEEGEEPEAAVLPGSAFVHRATPENVSDNSTYVDDPRTNGHPDAVLSVTQNWNPGGGGTYNDHPVGVWYDAGAGKWAIFNQDRAAMPEGAAFNVVVSRDPTEAAR